MSETVMVRERRIQLSGILTGMLLLTLGTFLYLLTAWRFPSLLPDPDQFLGQWDLHRDVTIDPALARNNASSRDWHPSIVLKRTDTDWQPYAMEWQNKHIPLPDRSYPIYFSASNGLLYVHRATDKLQVVTVNHDGQVHLGPLFDRIPFFGTNRGGWRPLEPNATASIITPGNGAPLYVGELPWQAYVVEEDRKMGPYQSIDSFPVPGSSKGASPLFLGRKNGQCLMVLGDTEYVR